MIISASYRTDIPAFYWPWFLARLDAGCVAVANPWSSRRFSVDLRPEAVSGFVIWTRNAASLLPDNNHPRLSDPERWPVVVQFTLTGYPRALERSVPEPAVAIHQMHELRARFGPKAVIWRYDPIVLSSLTPADWHRETFVRLAEALAGVTDEVTVSFVEPYAKTRRNMTAAAKHHGFDWQDTPTLEEQRALLTELAAIAGASGMRLTLCTQPGLAALGFQAARCIDAQRLSAIAGRPLNVKQKGNREGCYCAMSRDIGAYDTCPHGCVYCYAVSRRDKAQARHRQHDAATAVL